MLQHKQEERELKRYEGDIIKKQHQLRRTMEGVKNSKSEKYWTDKESPKVIILKLVSKGNKFWFE